MPYITQVAVGKRPLINVFGNDYNTPDGTGVKDYIHLVGLANGRLAALRNIYNLGTGKVTSVLGLVKTFENLIT